MECFTNIRLNILRQVEYGSDAYHLLKKWKDLLDKDCNLDNEPRYNSRFRQKLNKRQLLEMTLAISENLAQGYKLKEMYRNFNQNGTSENCEEWFDALPIAFKDSTISEYEPFITLLTNWRIEILNSFKRPYDDNRKLSNALSENANGKIKIYIAISRGISNFERFRKRILFALNKKVYYSITDKVDLQSK
ncbi:transposase [Breznakia blatticola]|uniref:Transposase n=1 Tax=Breznakia blatticola TaxID=1754012 RepID=A0A4R7ZQ29_9FIRM|nr:transposase [Breznakia blatticola]